MNTIPIVTSMTRTGSTRVYRVLQLLTEDPAEYGLDPFPESFQWMPGRAYKTHALTPDRFGIVDADRVRFIQPFRRFFDTIVSNILYECRTRRCQELETFPIPQESLHLPDETLVSAVIKECPSEIRRYCEAYVANYHTSFSRECLQVDYDQFLTEPLAVIASIIRWVGEEVTAVALMHIHNATMFSTMASDYAANRPMCAGFVRRGRSGVWRDYLTMDDQARVLAELARLIDPASVAL